MSAENVCYSVFVELNAVGQLVCYCLKEDRGFVRAQRRRRKDESDDALTVVTQRSAESDGAITQLLTILAQDESDVFLVRCQFLLQDRKRGLTIFHAFQSAQPETFLDSQPLDFCVESPRFYNFRTVTTSQAGNSLPFGAHLMEKLPDALL
jgi:hypothetical protein